MTGDLPAALAAAMAALQPPATIVTAAAGGRKAGCLVTFSTQCSVQPFRYLVCLSRENATFAVATAAATLAVHVPDRDAVALAELFGGATGHDTDKFAGVGWRPWTDGTPLLDGCAWFLGPVTARVPLGDHAGFVVEPTSASAPTAAAALRLDDVRHIQPGHAP